jgi:hypothetical protein
MSGRKLSKEQEKKIANIKQQWLAEAEVIIKADDEKKKQKHQDNLDGEATYALAKIQMKYKGQIQEVLGGFVKK